MFRAKRYAVLLLTNGVLIALLLAVASTTVLPGVVSGRPLANAFGWTTVSVLFIIIALVMNRVGLRLIGWARGRTLQAGENSLLVEFIEEMRYCYTFDDFYDIIGNVLERRADCAVLFIDRERNYVLYNSPSRLTCDKDVMHTLELNFPPERADGLYFLGDSLGVVTSARAARGFFIIYKKHQLFVFCRYTRLFDDSLYAPLYDEFCRTFDRTRTISDLSEISSLSSEWQQLANTQRAFLPPQMPVVPHLKLAAYYRPLVNVSGDYYTVLPISPSKTLLMLGDVSGKGLAAALVMGLVMNTVKILDNKEDLPNVIRAVDKAIKGMKLQDKYTVVFIGIVDTERMVIRYVNASMSDPIVITRSADGYRIKPLTSNCSLVGIIELPDIDVAEQRLFRGDVILMASDGVSEVMDERGVELGTTEQYRKVLRAGAAKPPREFINDVVGLIMSYSGGSKLRDDVTMLVAKVEG